MNLLLKDPEQVAVTRPTEATQQTLVARIVGRVFGGVENACAGRVGGESRGLASLAIQSRREKTTVNSKQRIPRWVGLCVRISITTMGRERICR